MRRPAGGWRWWRGAPTRVEAWVRAQGLASRARRRLRRRRGGRRQHRRRRPGLHRAPGPARRGDRQRRHQRRHGHRRSRRPRCHARDLRHQQRRPGRHLPPLPAPDARSAARARWWASPAWRPSAACPATAPIAPARPPWWPTARACAANCRGSGVRVVTLLPGYVATPLTARNPYAMPFLMSADRFADRAFDAIESGDQLPRHPVADGGGGQVAAPAAQPAVRQALRRPRTQAAAHLRAAWARGARGFVFALQRAGCAACQHRAPP